MTPADNQNNPHNNSRGNYKSEGGNNLSNCTAILKLPDKLKFHKVYLLQLSVD